MADKYTTDVLERVNGMSDSDVRKVLAEIFIEIRSIGVGGKTDQDAFKAIERIYRSEVVAFIKAKYDV